ncbi:MAG TPA: NAD(P)/FAD-dependent oxidoreductase [Labilithrix sp.]|nr:NAD(P)/FAD-dependent oxidoreductase [Labilithrix sp.]
MSKIDVTVIGLGAAGLATQALLAKAGLRVVGIEKRHKVGGLLSSFNRGGVPLVNLAGSFIAGTHETGFFGRFLRHIDAYRHVEFVKLPNNGRFVFEDRVVETKIDRGEVVAELQARYPGEREAIAEFYALCHELAGELIDFTLSEKTIGFFATFPFRFPKLIRYGSKSIGDVLTKRFRSPRLIAEILAPLSCYIPLDLYPVSFATASMMIDVSHTSGFSFVNGGTFRLAEAMQTAIEAAGGELRLGSGVSAVRRDGDGYRVELESGEQIRSRFVVSCVDSFQTYRRLVPDGALPRSLAKKLDTFERMPAYCATYFATTKSPHEHGIQQGMNAWFPGDDARQWFPNDWETALFGASHSYSLYSLAAPGSIFLEEGVYPLMMVKPVPSDYPSDIDTRKREVIERNKAQLSRLIPDLEQNLVLEDAFLPTDFARFASLPRGELAWMPYPTYSGPNAIGPKTPWKGFLTAGQWSPPGQGTFCCVLSGMEACRVIFRQIGMRGEAERLLDIGEALR